MFGYYLEGTNCLICNSATFCLTCETSASHCLTCTAGYSMENEVCVPNSCTTGAGYF